MGQREFTNKQMNHVLTIYKCGRYVEKKTLNIRSYILLTHLFFHICQFGVMLVISRFWEFSRCEALVYLESVNISLSFSPTH